MGSKKRQAEGAEPIPILTGVTSAWHEGIGVFYGEGAFPFCLRVAAVLFRPVSKSKEGR